MTKAELLANRKKKIEARTELLHNRQVNLILDRGYLAEERDAVAILAGDKRGILDEGLLLRTNTTELVDDKKVIWKPYPGPQTDFLAATEDEVLFSGGRGRGASDCLLVDPLRYCSKAKFVGLLIRRTMPELRDIISRAKVLYPKIYPGVKWKEMEKIFFFPSGAKIEFGYCESMDDAMRYLGQEYCWLGVDELTQYGDEKIIDSIIPSLRSSDPTIPISIRFTTNPSGPGRRWVAERFIDAGPVNTRITLTYNYGTEDEPELYIRTRRWIHGTMKDNGSLGAKYKAQLAAIPDPVRREQWMNGGWDLDDDSAFPDFKKELHVIEPFPIPNSWRKLRGCDWGYGSLAACLWLAIDYDKNVYVYREFTANGPKNPDKLTADKFAAKVLELERNENVQYGYLDSSVWSTRGEVGETVADTMMKMGCRWIPSDRSNGSRVAGKLLFHNYLAPDPLTKKPRIKIFSTCKTLIKELSSLSLDAKNTEDVDTRKDDHLWDSLRYALASLPNPGVNYQSFFSQSAPPILVNTEIGM